jgi:hypothetical protein
MTRAISHSICFALALIALCAATAAHSADPLPSWNDGAAKLAIVDFVARIAREGGPDYLPPAERIAHSTTTVGHGLEGLDILPIRMPAAEGFHPIHGKDHLKVYRLLGQEIRQSWTDKQLPSTKCPIQGWAKLPVASR